MANIYQIKVQLQGVSKPPVWRQLQVPSDISLYLLHCCIQGAMGWTNTHLHQFDVDGQYFGIPHEDYDEGMKDGRKKKLQNALKKVDTYMDYEYDFGDGWLHRITLEKILPTNPQQKLPVLLKGKGACPPEDCGGIWGYENLKEVMKNPAHEEYEDLSEWLGVETFDATAFDLEKMQDGMISAYEMGLTDNGESF
jgi:Plasmid pRiA4b ORF-3-like protein